MSERGRQIEAVRAAAGPEPTAEPAQFTLDRPGSAWLVAEGAVDLFVVDAEGADRWRPVATVAEGALLAAVPRAEGGHVLRGRVHPGGRVERIAIGALADAGSESAPAIAAAIDAGLAALLPALCRGLPPKEARGFDPDDRFELAAGETARLIDGIAWLDTEQGRVGLGARLGEPELSSGASTAVCADDWAVAAEAATLAAMPTLALLEDGSLWTGLEGLGADAAELIERAVIAAEERELENLASREERDRELAANTELSLAGTLAEREELGRRSRDALFAAAEIVAGAEGIQLRRPPSGGGGRERPLDELARASGIHTRPVSLDGEWWRDDAGPLIGYRGEERTPVALLRGGRGYRVRDPVAGTSEPLTALLAAELGDEGDMLYPALPPGELSIRKMIAFSVQGTRRDLWRLVLAALALMVLGTLTPILTGQILGVFLPREDFGVITTLCLILLAAALISGMLAALQNLAALRLEGHAVAKMQAGVWARIMALAPRELRGESTGDLATTALAPIAARAIVSQIAIRTLTSALVGFAGLALIFIYDLRLGVFTLALLTVLAAVTAVAARRQARRQDAILETRRSLASRSFQLIGNVDKLRMAGAEERGFAHWAEVFGLNRTQTYAARSSQNRVLAFSAGFTLVAAAFAYYLIAEVVEVPIATFLSFNVAFAQTIAGALLVSASVVTLAELSPLWRSLRELLERRVEDTADREDPGELAGEVEASRISFRYSEDGPLILDEVSLRAEPGEFVAIVGPSGSGKSTLLRLLLGFERPGSGAVLYDRQDLEDVDVGAVRRQCGVVLQDDRLLIGDLRTNIVGAGRYGEDEAWEAARLVGLAEDVERMPMKMATYVGEGTGSLSGGQRQRVILARAMVSRPRILYLDEATSALDNRTQDLVTESMRRLSATRIVIAHRLSTIRDADRILVMEAGRVVETGTYEELMASDGLFRELAERQLA